MSLRRVYAVVTFLLLTLLLCGCEESLRGQQAGAPKSAPVWEHARLFAYVQQGNEAALRNAIRAGADPNAVGPEGYSLVMQAVLSKNKDILKYLLSAGAKVDSLGCESIVVAATHANDLELVRLVVEAGAPVNRKSESQVLESPIVVAATYDNVPIMKYLLDHGADPDNAVVVGTTALHIASAKGNLEMLGMLVAKGADVNRRDNYGRTPLMYACEKGKAESVHWLLEKGADPSLLDAYGRDAARYAMEKAHSPEIAALCSGNK